MSICYCKDDSSKWRFLAKNNVFEEKNSKSALKREPRRAGLFNFYRGGESDAQFLHSQIFLRETEGDRTVTSTEAFGSQ